MSNSKHGSRLVFLILSAFILSPALAGFTEGPAQKRGDYEAARMSLVKLSHGSMRARIVELSIASEN
jgi:hypothetical protein